MNQLKNAVEFVTKRLSKEAIKNLSLFITVPLATTATTGLVVISNMNGKLQENLNAKEAEATELATELSSAQETIDDLNSQFATASGQVSSDILLNGRGDSKGTNGTVDNVNAGSTDGTTTGEVGSNSQTVTTTKTTLTTEEAKKLQDENKKLQDENKALSDTVNKLEKNSGGSNSNTTSAATQSRLNSLSSENATLSSKVDNLQTENEDLKAENEALKNTVNSLANGSSDTDKAYAELSDIALSLANDNANLGNQNNQLTSEYNDLAEDLSNVSSELNGYKESLVATSKVLSEAKNNVNLLTTDVSDLQKELEETEAQLEKVTNSYNELDGSIDSAALLEVYRGNVDDITAQISDIEKQIADIEKKEVWSDLDKARYDTLQARIDAGDDSLASFEEMANEMASLLEAHTYTDEDNQNLINLNAEKTALETSLADAQATLEEAEAQWLSSDPNDSLAAINATDKALREKIETLNKDIETKQAELEKAEKEASSYSAEMYRLKESIKTLEAQYNELAIEEKLHGSYEDRNGNVNFELEGSEEYNGVVSAIESMVTSLKNRINELLTHINNVVGDLKGGIPDAKEETDENGNRKITSKLIHKDVNIVLFEGTEDQVTIQGEMPYGQITKTSTKEDGTTSIFTYFKFGENGESSGVWGKN